MSLAVLANDIASKGRGEDSMLVHMTPGEVHGLQALALAHGGSLTINPDTGLPEAGFLRSILPMIAGMALNFIAPGVGTAIGSALGTSASVGTGLLVGGVTGLATGSLKQGIMAGLGAYGGAGLGGSLEALGTGAISSGAGAGAASAADIAAMADAGAGAAGATGAGTAGAGVIASPVATPSVTGLDLGPLGSEAGIGSAQNMLPPQVSAAPVTATSMPTPAEFAPLTEAQAAPLRAYDLEMAQQRAVGSALEKASPLDTMKAGFGEALDKPSKLFTKDNLKYGMAALSPMMMSAMTPKIPGQSEEDESMIRPYRFDPISGQYTRGTPYPTKQAKTRFGFDGGGIVALADGGTSRRNESAYARAYANRYGRRAPDAVAAVEPPIMGPMPDRATPGPAVVMPPEGPITTMPVTPPQGSAPAQPPQLTGGSSDAYNYLMGRGAYPTMPRIPGGGPIMRPYAELMGVPQDPTKQKFIWDQQTRRYIPNPQYVAPVDPGAKAEEAASSGTTSPDFRTDPVETYAGGGGAAGGLPALARGGMESHLGDYSDGGRLLRGPGDGVSDSIPAVIANKRPARLADGEFVVPARIVSELGNGSTEAGARKLYAMMDRVQKNRRKSVGRGKVAVDSNSDKYLPA